MTTGDNIKRLRKCNGLSQRELAQQMSVGYSTISLIEKHNQAFSTEVLTEFCRIFKCKPNDIVVI